MGHAILLRAFCRCKIHDFTVLYFCAFQEATENKGVDVILEMLSNVNLEKDLGLLSQNGIVGVCARSQNGNTIAPHVFSGKLNLFGSVSRRM